MPGSALLSACSRQSWPVRAMRAGTHPRCPRRRCRSASRMRCSCAALLSARVGRVQICVHNEQLVVLRSCEESHQPWSTSRFESAEVDVSAIVHHGGQRSDSVAGQGTQSTLCSVTGHNGSQYCTCLPCSAADSTVAKLDSGGARTKVVNSVVIAHVADAPESTIGVEAVAVCALCCCDQGRTQRRPPQLLSRIRRSEQWNCVWPVWPQCSQE
jgi:hypothetical protein